MKLEKYTPSSWAREHTTPLRGLSSLVAALRAAGYTVAADFEDYMDEVNAHNVNMACHEMDGTYLRIIEGDKCIGWILVIPSNATTGCEGDWLSDYAVSRSAPELAALMERETGI